jgi:hypothetical protein
MASPLIAFYKNRTSQEVFSRILPQTADNRDKRRGMKKSRYLIALATLLAILAAHPSRAGALKPLTLKDLEALIAQQPIEGQPLSPFEAFQQVPGASEFAADVLTQKTKAAQWSNAVFALGAIGDRKAQETLDSFLRDASDPLTGTTKLSPTMFNAKVDSLFAFGYMALHSPDQQVKSTAKRFLDEAAAPSAKLWQGIQWESPYHATKTARNAYLVSKVRLVMSAIATQSGGNNKHQADTSLARRRRDNAN